MSRTQTSTPPGAVRPDEGLQDGIEGGIEVRAASAADCEAIRSFVAGLSPRARFLRFFTPAATPSPSVLRGLCGAGRTTDVLLATAAGAVIGHAMAADAVGPDGRRVTDIGLLVADRWQQQGVGSDLLRRLIARAEARGVSGLELEVLPENRAMLAMIHHRWADAGYSYGGGAVTVRVPLTDPGTTKGGGGDSALRAA
jgi:ribosomal protein S18 acetylase RimI-like enzyme